jgi:Fe-S cluster biogenesis protein NfuA
MDQKNSKNKTESKIKKALVKIRPGLQADGGDVRFVSWDEKSGILKVALEGACMGCPMSALTLEHGIAQEVKKEVKEVKEVEAV